MTRLVSATLDDKSYAIWATLPNKSAWLRKMLSAVEGVSDSDHRYSDEAREAGKWGGKCNPNNVSGACGICWTFADLEGLARAPNSLLYLPPE